MNHVLSSDLQPLIGLTLFKASYAGDMREFGFARPVPDGEDAPEEWWLHIQCPWRIENAAGIVTGKSDWWETEDGADPPDDWDPARGGSLQSMRLRQIFRDPDAVPKGTIRNRSGGFVVTNAVVNEPGDLNIELTGGFHIRAFPDGCKGEFWRVFKRHDLNSHLVS